MLILTKDLKRCPFCNGQAGIYTNASGNFFAQCNQCGVVTMRSGTEEKAVEAWNRRTHETS